MTKKLAKFAINICETLGKNNNPLYTVVAIACFKGILRPTFTMMDKKQSKESKTYAAVREGATELIAIPTYIAMSNLVKLFTKFLAEKKENISKVQSNSSFIGVCLAAVFVIPALCNLAMPHILNAYKKLKAKKDDVDSLQLTYNNSQAFNNTKRENIYKNFNIPKSCNTGMRVGL